MSKVQLIYTGVSQIVGGPELGLLILSDLSRIRQVAIVCDSRMEYELSLRAAGTSLTERLLPEVLCSINPRMTGEHYEVLFNSIIDGQYKALLVDKDDLTLTPIRASDAVLLAQVAKLDIFMIALPVNALSMEMLRHALDKAIEEENYELASMLRDEMRHRKKDA